MVAVAEQLVSCEPALLERAFSRYADFIMRHGELHEAESLLRRVVTSLETEWPGRKEREDRFGKKGPSLLEVLSTLRVNLVRQGKVDEADLIDARMREIRAASQTDSYG